MIGRAALAALALLTVAMATPATAELAPGPGNTIEPWLNGGELRPTTTTTTTLPACPPVVYDGDLTGPGPIWDTPDHQAPTYDCTGPTPPAELGPATIAIAPADPVAVIPQVTG